MLGKPMPSDSPSARLRVAAAGKTDVGRRRKHNEDSILVKPELQLFVVADGMGGHNAGEVASALAARSLDNFFSATATGVIPAEFAGADSPITNDARRLASSVRKANADVYEIASTRRQHAGMGSTVVAAHVSERDRRVHICHVGDSRCYRIRDGEIEQLTRDHSLINDALAMRPDLTEEILAELPKNVITRAVGTQESLEVDLRSERLLEGDLYLLCSDGLSGQVTAEQILEVASITTDLEELCDLLIIMANDSGGPDNITVIAIRIDELAAAAELEAEADAPKPKPRRRPADSVEIELGEDGELEQDVEESEAEPPATPEPDATIDAAGAVANAAARELSVVARQAELDGERAAGAAKAAADEEVAAEETELDEALAAHEQEQEIVEQTMLAEEPDADVLNFAEQCRREQQIPLPAPGPPVQVLRVLTVGDEPQAAAVSGDKPTAAEPAPPPKLGDAQALVCAVCGEELIANNRYCVECGTRVGPESSALLPRADLIQSTEAAVEIQMDEEDDGARISAEADGSPEPSAVQRSPASAVQGLADGPSFCHQCGARLIAGNRYCVECGVRCAS